MWQQVFEARLEYFSRPTVLNYLFRTSTLVVKSELPGATRTFKLAGKLTPLFYDNAFGDSTGKGRKIYLGTQQITFENPLGQEFKLEFSLFPWVANINLTFWATDSLPLELRFLENIRLNLAEVEEKIDTNYGQ